MPAPDLSAAPSAAPPAALGLALLWFVAGWSLGRLLLPAAAEIPTTPRCTLQLEPLPPRPPSTRAWRSVPGVGRRRALAIARAYWRAGPSFDAEEVPGVGPVTGAAVRRFLANRP